MNILLADKDMPFDEFCERFAKHVKGYSNKEEYLKGIWEAQTGKKVGPKKKGGQAKKVRSRKRTSEDSKG
jgi:hypothetical protein